MATSLQTEGLPENSFDSVEDLKAKLSDELSEIFDVLNKIKTKEEIGDFFKSNSSDIIKKLLNFILIDSPNEGTRILKKLIDLVDNTMRAKPDALNTSIHYGIGISIK